MSVLVGKLVSLGLDDLAIKELRILKRRLESGDGAKRKPAKTSAAPAAQTLAELLNFGKPEFAGAKLGLVITSQLQVLRLMTSCRKPKVIEDGFEILHTEHPSSPTRLLLLAAKDSKDQKQTDRIVRQMQTLSEILLSLCPSISTADDALALESRLSISPEVSIQIQTLALHNRFLWWGLAGHKGDQSKEILDPFLRCLSALARRNQTGALKAYQVAALAMTDIHTLISDCSDSRPRALRTTLAGIFRLLSSLSKEADLMKEAVRWTLEWQKTLDSSVDSDAKRCSVLARLVALQLKDPSNDPKDEEVLLSLLEELERPFKGESSEIDELMTEISGVRRSAISVIAQYRSGTGSKVQLSDGMRQMCESVIFLLPRLSPRYLGNPPDVKAATKKFTEALAILQVLDSGHLSQLEAVDHGLAMAKQFLFHSLDQMNADPVYSVLQDSTISFPSVAGLAKNEKHGDRLSVVKVSPPRKGARGARELAGSKSPVPDSFFDKLRQAQEHLTEIQSMAVAVAPVSVVHTASALLNSVAILLSAAGQVKGRSLAHPGLASSSIGMSILQQVLQ